MCRGWGEDVSTGRIERDVFAVDKGGGVGTSVVA